MFPLNFMVVIATGIIPLLVGFIWYSDKAFGTAWKKSVGLTDEQMQASNMALILGLTLVFGIMLAGGLMPMVIHQMHLFSMLQHQEATLADPNSALSATTKGLMDQYGGEFRTFKHGAFHGILGSIFIALPVLAINALFERKSRQYILIHLGYWAITFALMGGIISAFA